MIRSRTIAGAVAVIATIVAFLGAEPARAQGTSEELVPSQQTLLGVTGFAVEIDISGMRDIPESTFRTIAEKGLSTLGLRVLPAGQLPSLKFVLDAYCCLATSDGQMGSWTLELRVIHRATVDVPGVGHRGPFRVATLIYGAYGAGGLIGAVGSVRRYAEDLMTDFINDYRAANAK